MSAQVLDCKVVAQAISEECKAAADELKAKGITPKLGIVRVGEKGPDLSYEKGATKTMNEAGIEVEVFALPADISQDDYIAKMKELNADPTIHGILAFRPLDNIDENAAIGEILNPLKDVDACTAANMGKLVVGDPTGLYPCTAAAIVEVINYYAEQIKATVRPNYEPLPLAKPGQEDDVACGLDVCIINNSNVIGKPASMLLTNLTAFTGEAFVPGLRVRLSAGRITAVGEDLSPLDGEETLHAATDKFIRRFERMEKRVEKEGKKLSEMTLAQMDEYWEAAKVTEIL